MAETPDRRSAARIVVPWPLNARVLEGREVRILDLSTAGVGIEHAEPLQPGTSCTLEFPLPFGPLRLTARVVWSMLGGADQTRDAAGCLHYRSGLAFVGLTPEQQAAVARALETLQARGGQDRQASP
jgi:hypothetical protein